MNKFVKMVAIMVTAATLPATALATTPEEDRMAVQNHMMKKFPGVPLQEYANGVYAIDSAGRENWEAIEEFPPYETAIDAGKKMWEKKFSNGKSYQSCFGNPVIAHKYPQWDAKQQQVVTLALALNQCLEANGEKPMGYKKGAIANILSYIAYESRGNKTNVEIPKDQPGAMAAFEAGKKFFYDRRGQLNLACANCHIQQAGQQIRSEILSPALGQTTHFPVYRSKWASMGTLHRRFGGCNEQVRAKSFPAQGDEYRNLEYFLTYMSNGIELNGPGARK
jgi:sulfur-oxidizing protein SoxA